MKHVKPPELVRGRAVQVDVEELKAFAKMATQDWTTDEEEYGDIKKARSRASALRDQIRKHVLGEEAKIKSRAWELDGGKAVFALKVEK